MSTESKQLTKIDAQIEVLPPSALDVMQRAEIDLQIATAHKFPRSMAKFISSARAMALIDEDTAASCIYSRPVGGGKFAEGLSVRAAEIVGASYGNLRVGATIIEQTERFVKARGFAHDLESNFAVSTEVIEPTIKKDGSPYDERMRIVIAKAALAKARRDATFQVVPKALFKSTELECRKLALGDAQSISTRRARISAWITKLAIDPKRVWKALGVAGEADLNDDHFLTLTGLKTAMSDGEVTIDDAFPPIIAAGGVGSKTPMEAANDASKPAKPAGDAAEEPKKPEPEQPKGPTAEDLKKSIVKAITSANIGKGVLVAKLVEKKTLPENTKWDGLTRDQLIPIEEGIAELIAEINAK